MRKVNVKKIKDAVSELCIKANISLRQDVLRALKKARRKEKNKRSKHVLDVIIKNAHIAKTEKRPICQDTGMVSLYIEIGQSVQLIGGNLEKAVQEGVRRGYREGFLRKSVVKSPFIRVNTKKNTPAIISTEIVPGNHVKITVMPKGFGSENKSGIAMLNPTEGEKEIISFVLDVVKSAGPDACPPYILGIGIGGTFDKAASLAKRALIESLDKQNPKKYLRILEKRIVEKINKLSIGAMGLGGKATCIGVNILEYPTHIAGLPVAVNVGCHATRSASRVI